MKSYTLIFREHIQLECFKAIKLHVFTTRFKMLKKKKVLTREASSSSATVTNNV